MKHRRMLGALAFACALVALTPACNEDKPDVPIPAATTTTHAALTDDMRMLWTEHVVWTRVYIIDAVAGLPDTGAAADRLFQNQENIGDAIKPFYGEDAGNQLTALLKTHIAGAAAVLSAAQAGDQARFDEVNAAWYANAYEIAAFLAAANPNWSEADLRAMMVEHLDKTLAEASARLMGDWDADVAAYDAIEAQILMMADMLTEGITAQFPDQVTTDTDLPADQTALHLSMRQLWEEHVTWTRVFIIDDLAGLPDVPQATTRLLQNQTDIGNAIKPFYGEGIGDKLTELLEVHITGAAAVVDAAKAGDQARFKSASDAWYENAADIASFLSSVNPYFSHQELKEMMDTHLDQTTNEAAFRLKGDWEGDIAQYDDIEQHILMMSDALSSGISQQFMGGGPAIH